MKTISSIFFVLFAFMANASATEITICREHGTVFPWLIDDKKDEEGLAVYQLKLISKLTNVKFKIISLPWKRCQFEVQSGKIDALLSASYNLERAAWGVYPKKDPNTVDTELSTHFDSFIVFTRKDSPIEFKNGAFINPKNAPVGVQRGYSVAYNLTQLGHKIIPSFISSEEVLLAIKEGTIDVGIVQYYSALKDYEKNPELKEALTQYEEPFVISEQYIVFSNKFFKDNQDLVKKIWSKIPETKKDKTYVELKRKYDIK